MKAKSEDGRPRHRPTIHNKAPRTSSHISKGDTSPPLAIQSVGLPPERHADRVVAEMMRHLAQSRASLYEAIRQAIENSSDGTPRAQRKMADRIERAGALCVDLAPGKRGRYSMVIYDITGWDAERNAEITAEDPIPEKPWVVCNVSILDSRGGGKGKWRRNLTMNSRPMLFITHHAFSRMAQRLGLRTSEHLLAATRIIWNACVDFINERGLDRWLELPASGERVPIHDDGSVVVLKLHEKREALVAATVF